MDREELEHDPEKRETAFGKSSGGDEDLERDGDRTGSHPSPEHDPEKSDAGNNPARKRDQTRPPYAARRLLTTGLLPALPVGIAGAFLFRFLHMPLPFVLGPMYACLLFNLFFPLLSSPRWLRAPVIALIGVMLGTTFTVELFASLGLWVAPLLGLIGVVAVCIVLNYGYYRGLVGYDRVTALYSSAPGGLVEMVVLGTQSGGKETLIALAHATRVLLVVMLLPLVIRFILDIPITGRSVAGPHVVDTPLGDYVLIAACAALGATGAKMLRLPANFFIGPLLISAAVHLAGWNDFRVPLELVNAAQILLGIGIGTGFAGLSRGFIIRSILNGFVASILMVTAALAGAFVVSGFSQFDISLLLLAYAPGGFAEMSLIAYALGADPAIVTTLHLSRMLLVLFVVPLLFKLVIRRRSPTQGGDAK